MASKPTFYWLPPEVKEFMIYTRTRELRAFMYKEGGYSDGNHENWLIEWHSFDREYRLFDTSGKRKRLVTSSSRKADLYKHINLYEGKQHRD